MRSSVAIIRDETGGAATTAVLLIAMLFMSFLVWATFTEIEEVTRGDGRVIPSQKTQIVQSSEPGVIQEIAVNVGQRIAKNDLLFRLDKTPTSANLGEVEAQVRAITAQIARLQLENEGRQQDEYRCPEEVKLSRPGICDNEARLYLARGEILSQRIKVFEERAEQKQRELNEVVANIERLKGGLSLAKKELALIAPLSRKELVAATELIRTQRAAADLEGQLQSATQGKARVEAGLREATLEIEAQTLEYRRTALTELTEARNKLAVVEETVRGATERVRRTEIRSPVDGIVNEVVVSTQGAFVNAGDRVVTIVPVEDALLVEARIRPSDIAFVHPGQTALVKVTAYDFSVYGGVEGTTQNVSADTLVDPNTKEPYYTVLVKTKETFLKSKRGIHAIIPGMVCNVDIITGKKTVMQYLLKPINKARELAMRER